MKKFTGIIILALIVLFAWYKWISFGDAQETLNLEWINLSGDVQEIIEWFSLGDAIDAWKDIATGTIVDKIEESIDEVSEVTLPLTLPKTGSL